MSFEIKNPKFPKGPWIVIDGQFIVDKNGLQVANLPEQNSAVAKAIATLPEMFDVLNALILLGKIDERHPAYPDVVAVIKKARGE